MTPIPGRAPAPGSTASPRSSSPPSASPAAPAYPRPRARPPPPAPAPPPAGTQALVPVPLRPRRLPQREFNQAALLARGARAHHRRGAAPPVAALLQRTRDTAPQSSLDAAV